MDKLLQSSRLSQNVVCLMTQSLQKHTFSCKSPTGNTGLIVSTREHSKADVWISNAIRDKKPCSVLVLAVICCTRLGRRALKHQREPAFLAAIQSTQFYFLIFESVSEFAFEAEDLDELPSANAVAVLSKKSSRL